MQELIGSLQFIRGIYNMGKSSLIIVLGMSIIIAFFILRLNANSTESVAGTMNMFEQMHSRLIANSGVEIYLEKFKWDLPPKDVVSSFTDNNLFNGTYYIEAEWDAVADSILRVTSKSDFMGITHTTVAEAWADVFDVPLPPGALYLSANTINNIMDKSAALKGDLCLDGRDHLTDGTLITDPDTIYAVPGIAVDESVDEALKDAVISYFNDNTTATIDGYDSDDLDLLSIEETDNDFEWTDYAQQLADSPDITVTPFIKDDGAVPEEMMAPWGTLLEPKVTFINTKDELMKIDYSYTKDPDKVIRGCGILIINGDLQIENGFDFVGLVIAYKETDLALTLNGGRIIGGMIGTGEEISLDIVGGKFTILYCSDAFNFIDELLQTERWNILSWWEKYKNFILQSPRLRAFLLDSVNFKISKRFYVVLNRVDI